MAATICCFSRVAAIRKLAFGCFSPYQALTGPGVDKNGTWAVDDSMYIVQHRLIKCGLPWQRFAVVLFDHAMISDPLFNANIVSVGSLHDTGLFFRAQM